MDVIDILGICGVADLPACVVALIVDTPEGRKEVRMTREEWCRLFVMATGYWTVKEGVATAEEAHAMLSELLGPGSLIATYSSHEGGK